MLPITADGWATAPRSWSPGALRSCRGGFRGGWPGGEHPAGARPGRRVVRAGGASRGYSSPTRFRGLYGAVEVEGLGGDVQGRVVIEVEGLERVPLTRAWAVKVLAVEGLSGWMDGKGMDGRHRGLLFGSAGPTAPSRTASVRLPPPSVGVGVGQLGASS